jgi:glycosyltransferase involved in cell wall biosynthesis
MKIAIDYNAALRQNAGIGRYTRDLVRAVLDLDSDDEVVLFYAGRDLPAEHPGLQELRALALQSDRVRAVAIPLSERWLTIAWQRARLPIPVERWTGPVDLVHAPDFVLPPVRRAPTLLTVHDLTFRIHPETAHANLRRYLERAVPRSLARATHILADSQSTKRDLERLMGVSPARVTVLYPGVGPRFRRVDDSRQLQAVRARLKLPPRFLFSVGTLEPRKNLQRLMRAFAQVRRDQPALDDTELLLAGKPGWLSDAIVADARATPGVRLLGPVDDADLPALYTLATATVYPSFYEGFGFPPLESLACGTPVLTSNTSSLPEVVGDVGILVDPLDEAAIADGMTRLLTDASLAEDARRRGPKQAARFSWSRAAHQLFSVYHMLAP